MKKYAKIVIAGILLSAAVYWATFSLNGTAGTVSADTTSQTNGNGTRTQSEKIVIQNFVVKTLQAVPVVEIQPSPTPAPTRNVVETTGNSVSQPQPVWAPTALPGRAVEIVPTDANVKAPEYACNVTVNRPYYFEQFSPGEDFDLDVTFTNTGTQEWGTDVDVMQYTGMRLEIEGKYLYDIDKDYDSAVIVYPGQSIRWKIRMEAPKEQSHDDNKYFATYNLIRARSADLAAGYRNEDENGMFCPFSFYIYVP